MKKYVPFAPVKLQNRTWVDKTITKAPIWCSVDLRDGNQSLVEPMGSEKKHRMFKTLVDMGYKQIEVGFPSASQTDFDFLRELIDGNLIPDDVTIQVLVQAREELIKRTYQGLQGAKNAIVHFYNSTSTIQREVVFCKDMDAIKDIAINGAKLVKQYSTDAIASGCNLQFQYSPESFSQTELPYALDVCEEVLDILDATDDNKVIINLPATVEVCTPNIHADQIEWMCQNFRNRNRVILSLHPHNDRGTGIAATELGLLAGADRVEGTLFGNGERTGNVCLVTLGLNMHTQGVNPNIDFSTIDDVVKVYEHCTNLAVPERHPYAGQLVYTAFSGSHQDAINKGLKALRTSNSNIWNVPYLPIDPEDVGRSYEAIIRINSQSGKGGIAYVLEADYGIKLPKPMQASFSKVIQKLSDKTGAEQKSKDIYNAFCQAYLSENVYKYHEHETQADLSSSDVRLLEITIGTQDTPITIKGAGSGPLESLNQALNNHLNLDVKIVDYSEHAMGMGDDAVAMAYVQLQSGDGKINYFGAGKDHNITVASLKALLSAYQSV